MVYSHSIQDKTIGMFMKQTINLWIKATSILMIGLLTATLSGCSWVKPVVGAHKISVKLSSEIKDCQRLGETNTSALDQVGFYQRDDDAITEDLVMLAKNEAVRMQGDTIVAITPLVNGRKTFAIYKCLK